MNLFKYLHSCILLEEGDTRILIDPGEFSFIEGTLNPQDIPPPHAVFITHSHSDHFFPEALKTIVATNAARIYANPEVAAQAKTAGLLAQEVSPGHEIRQGPFTVKVIAGDHGELPIPIPMNTGFLVNDRVFHPGDSYTSMIDHVEVLLLPVSAPWQRLVDALRFAERLKPKLVIPIHDAMIKDFFLQRIYERMCRPVLAKSGIEFKPLGLGESVEI